MRVALSLASRFGAWVTGYYVSPTQGVFEGVPNAASDLRAPPEMEEVSAGDVAEEVLAEFEDGLKSKGLGGSWILSERSADLSDLVARARCVDLVVAALAPLPGYPADLQPPIDIDPVVVGCGRPVLGLPLANLPEKIGSDVVIAWDGSREAARAVHERPALPPPGAIGEDRIAPCRQASAGGAGRDPGSPPPPPRSGGDRCQYHPMDGHTRGQDSRRGCKFPKPTFSSPVPSAIPEFASACSAARAARSCIR